MSITQPSPRSNHALFVLRTVAALIFISAGTSKLFDVPSSGMPGMPVPLFSFLGLAGLLLPDRQRRRPGGPLLLPVPLPGVRRWRRLEPRPRARA